jgi:hypothetical protein
MSSGATSAVSNGSTPSSAIYFVAIAAISAAGFVSAGAEQCQRAEEHKEAAGAMHPATLTSDGHDPGSGLGLMALYEALVVAVTVDRAHHCLQ